MITSNECCNSITPFNMINSNEVEMSHHVESETQPITYRLWHKVLLSSLNYIPITDAAINDTQNYNEVLSVSD